MLIFSRYGWWIAAMVGLALFLTAAGQVGVLHPVQGTFLRVVSPVENVLNGIFRPVATILSDAGDLRALQEENRRLRLDNESLQNKLIELQTDAARVKELEEALGIQQGDESQTLLAANVVSHDTSAFSDVISIDRGSSHGVRVGMNVLSSQGSLMGTVTDVFSSRSFVRLITDSKSRVNAEVQETKFEGIVKGGPERSLTFDLVEADVKVGDKLVTSGLGGNYQKDLPIGTVVEVSGTPQDLYKTVKVEPQVRLSTVDTALVLLSFVPERIVLDE